MSALPVASLFKVRASQDTPVNLLSIGRAWAETIGPVAISGQQFASAAGAQLTSAPDIGAALVLPGVLVKDLVWGDVSGAIEPGEAPSAILSGQWDATQLPSVYGATNVRLLKSLLDVWDRADQVGIWTTKQVEQIRAIIRCGLPVWALSLKGLSNSMPGAPAGVVSIPPERLEAFGKIVARFDAIRTAYYRSQFTAAAEAGEALAADVAFWETVYVVVEAIHDAPAAVAGAVSDGVLSLAGGILGKAWPLLLLAGGAAALWYLWPVLAKALKIKVAAKLGVSDA